MRPPCPANDATSEQSTCGRSPKTSTQFNWLKRRQSSWLQPPPFEEDLVEARNIWRTSPTNTAVQPQGLLHKRRAGSISHTSRKITNPLYIPVEIWKKKQGALVYHILRHSPVLGPIPWQGLDGKQSQRSHPKTDKNCSFIMNETETCVTAYWR